MYFSPPNSFLRSAFRRISLRVFNPALSDFTLPSGLFCASLPARFSRSCVLVFLFSPGLRLLRADSSVSFLVSFASGGGFQRSQSPYQERQALRVSSAACGVHPRGNSNVTKVFRGENNKKPTPQRGDILKAHIIA